jgi:hypothetical protein
LAVIAKAPSSSLVDGVDEQHLIAHAPDASSAAIAPEAISARLNLPPSRVKGARVWDPFRSPYAA